jgi:hypothetical protein
MEDNYKTNRDELKTGLKDFNLELRSKFDELKQEQLKLVENTEKSWSRCGKRLMKNYKNIE